MRGHLARGPPVDESGFGDGEGDAYVPASPGDGGERFLHLEYVVPISGGGYSD